MTYQRCQLFTKHNKIMTASFAAAHTQIVPTVIQLCIANVRYTLLYDVQLEANQQQADWIVLQKVAEASPSATLIGNWVRELACVQVIVLRTILSENNVLAFFQTDGGHAGQEVSLFLMYTHDRNQAEQI